MDCFLPEFLELFCFSPSHLVKGFVANVAPERLLTGVGQPVVLVVALLMKPLATELADVGAIAEVDSHVCI